MTFDGIGFEQADLTPEQAQKTVALHDAWNTMLATPPSPTASSGSTSTTPFNGADGSEPSADLLADDYTHARSRATTGSLGY